MMPSSLSLRSLRSLAAFTAVLSLAAAGAQAIPMAQISFTESAGRVSSIDISSLSFTVTANYSNSQIQLRIFDLYAGSGTIDTGNIYTGFTVQKNAETPLATPVNFTPWTTTLGGNSTDGDMIVWIDMPFSMVAGDTLTISGSGVSNGLPAAQILAPSGGVFSVNLISSANGSAVGTPVSASLNVGAIPEPSSYASVFGALALTGALAARRRRR